MRTLKTRPFPKRVRSRLPDKSYAAESGLLLSLPPLCVLLFCSFFVIIQNAVICACADAANIDFRNNRMDTLKLKQTEQNDGGRGLKGVMKRVFGSLRDGSAEEFASDMRWIFGYTKKYKWFVVVQTLFGVLSASLSLVSAIISKYAIDIVINKKIGSLWLLVAAVAASAVAGLVFSSLQSRVSAKIALRVNNDMRAELFDKLMRADWQGVKKFQSGDILNRLNGDTQTAASIAISWIPSVIVTGFSFVSSFVTILFYNVPMAFIALISAPFLVVVSRGLMKKSRLFHKLVLEKESALMSFETETFCNYDTVKSLGAAEAYGERFRDKQEECKTASLDNNLFLIRANILLTVSSYVVSFATFGYCLSLIWRGAISYGTMTFFLQQRARITAGFSAFIKLVPQLLNSAVSARRVRELSDLPPEPQIETPAQVESLVSRPLSLRLTNVDFCYSDDAGGKPVLTQSSFSAEPGEIIAVIGASGQGKTTLLRLILGLIRPERGVAELVDDSGTAHTVSAEHRKLFSYVPQGNTVFSGTIAENLRIVRPDASDEELTAALDAACALRFVTRMGGIDSCIGEKGHGISEGQAQRLAIARAILRDAPILLLDEATSGLDIETEQQIIRNIIAKGSAFNRSGSAKKTCIVATHRPSILALCDKIFRVQDSRITLVSAQEAESFFSGR